MNITREIRRRVVVRQRGFSTSTIAAAQLKLGSRQVEITWDKIDQSKQALPPASSFHHLWLRDNCPCPACVHPSNRQKLHSSADVASNPRLKAAELKTGEHGEKLLEIHWDANSMAADSQLPNRQKPHTSVFKLEWLQKNDYSANAIKRRFSSLLAPTVWDGKQYESRRQSVEYSDLVSTSDGLRAALVELKRHGLCFIRNVPTKPKQVEEVAHRFGCIRETFYGTSWDVKSVPEAKNIAYTSLNLGLHMDLMYFEAPPGLQFLHSLQNSVTGGESIFLDSFKAVQILKETDPDAYRTLTTCPVTFHYVNDGHKMHFRRPSIVENDYNEPLMVYYAPPFQGPLEISDSKQLEAFYRAFAKFDEILRDPKLIYQTLLEPGDCVVFANRRVLHGRQEFDAQSGDRHLKGTYVDWDDFKDKLRVFDVTD
ncbi:hypothetical protein DFS34DRAFT_605415 [Phlyctochytrium arcticum]|nr:hypothetical protein DFS34DRAFT_605415 [Phlyctochytrium arcticum]